MKRMAWDGLGSIRKCGPRDVWGANKCSWSHVHVCLCGCPFVNVHLQTGGLHQRGVELTRCLALALLQVAQFSARASQTRRLRPRCSCHPSPCTGPRRWKRSSWWRETIGLLGPGTEGILSAVVFAFFGSGGGRLTSRTPEIVRREQEFVPVDDHSISLCAYRGRLELLGSPHAISESVSSGKHSRRCPDTSVKRVSVGRPPAGGDVQLPLRKLLLPSGDRSCSGAGGVCTRSSGGGGAERTVGCFHCWRAPLLFDLCPVYFCCVDERARVGRAHCSSYSASSVDAAKGPCSAERSGAGGSEPGLVR